MKKASLFLAISFTTINLFASYVPGVPYFYQYNNTNNPGGSCQNTSLAMCIKYFGGTAEYPDAVSNVYGTTQAQSVSGLQTVFNTEAANFNLTVRDVGHSNGTFSQIQALLAAGIPVIVHGYFTSYGHVMVLTGYNGVDYIANDPAGKWSQQYQNGGYCQCSSTEGHDVLYSKAAMEQAIGPDGTVWYHQFINITPADTIAPGTTINVANDTSYKTTNFTVNFTDSDNAGGSGLDKSFYSVLDYTGAEWRSNNQNGFFCDNFDSAIHPDWTLYSNNWSIQNHALYQSDEASTNTNFSAQLNQGLSNRYIYHFAGKIDGSGTNRCAGIHIFSDDITQINRGNNYLIWFKPDASEVHIYKINNNTIGAPHCVFTNVSINTGIWYDYKIMYDRTTGKFSIWMNDHLKGTYTDSTNQLLTGSGISFRTRECNFTVDDFKVYRSRPGSVNVSTGSANADVRYQSPAPGIYACKVKSLAVDSSGNISANGSKSLLMDWTAPAAISIVNDGLNVDIDTVYNNTPLSANWAASNDANSGIAKYLYAIGTTPGSNDIINWTDNGLSTSVTQTGLTLSSGQVYYFTVKAENVAGLFSATTNSNGQYVELTPTGISNFEQNTEIAVFPNPFSEKIVITYEIKGQSPVEIILYDVTGREMWETTVASIQSAIKQKVEINTNEIGLTKGIYILKFQTNESKKYIKLICE